MDIVETITNLFTSQFENAVNKGDINIWFFAGQIGLIQIIKNSFKMKKPIIMSMIITGVIILTYLIPLVVRTNLYCFITEEYNVYSKILEMFFVYFAGTTFVYSILKKIFPKVFKTSRQLSNTERRKERNDDGK